MELTTEELHKHVWSATLDKAAENIGVTVSILRTLCANYSITRPSVADWAKVRKGAVSSITELAPAFAAPMRTISFLDEAMSKDLSASERRRIEVLPKRMHPAVTGVTSVRDGWGPAAIHNPAIADVRAKSKVVARRDRFASSIAYACDSLGGSVTAENGLYRVQFGAGHILLKVTERLRRVHLPITQTDRTWKTANFKRGWRGGWEPTGKLVCEVDTYCAGFQQRWEDTDRVLLETQVERLVGTFRAMCHGVVEDAKTRAEKDEKRRIQRLAHEEEVARRRLADERWGRFAAYSEKWQAHSQQAQFLQHLKSMPARADDSVEGIPLSAWITWLEERLANSDPTRGGVKALLSRMVLGS